MDESSFVNVKYRDNIPDQYRNNPGYHLVGEYTSITGTPPELTKTRYYISHKTQFLEIVTVKVPYRENRDFDDPYLNDKNYSYLESEYRILNFSNQVIETRFYQERSSGNKVFVKIKLYEKTR